MPQINIGIKLKAIFEGTNNGTEPVTVTITRATLVTAKGRNDLLVKGPKGEPFARTFDPQSPKMVEYGAILAPRFPPGTRYALVFELTVDGTKKLLRSGILAIEKKE